MIYYIILPFKININNNNFKFVNNKFNFDNLDEYKIIPLSNIDYYLYNNYLNNIFKNNLDNIEIFNNKSRFAEYMMNNFINTIPKVYYYNYEEIEYINFDDNNKKIIKPNCDNGGQNIEIIFDNKIKKNNVISKYIQHNRFYTGHLLIKNGIIIHKIYFFSYTTDENYIQRGAIQFYQIKYNINDDIFNKIFEKINYNGFACIDFIIENDNIIIFEINPRIGGSLINNIPIFSIFLDKIIDFF